MNKKYAFYCSGGASRVLKFYSVFSLDKYPFEFVFYDGKRNNISKQLSEKFGNKLIEYAANKNPSDFLLDKMLEFKIDFLFCFGDRILKGRILEVYKNKIINFHPSLLPAFSGLNAIDKALNSSVQILGNTAHFIDEGIDTGPIIMQSVIPRNSYTCYEDVLSLQIPMLLRIWELIDSNKITVIDNLVVVKSLRNKDPFFSL